MKNSWIPIEFLARIVSTYLRNITTAVLFLHVATGGCQNRYISGDHGGALERL